MNGLISLKVEDLDIADKRLRILHAEMNKQRVVGVGGTALEALTRYLDIRGDESGQLFLSSRGRVIRPNSIRVMLRRLAERAGVSHVYPHKFRHTSATWALESEARELDVQLLLGHSSSAMVRRYSSTYNAEKAARSHARWSPADQLGGSASK